ncbi:hypothetical protein C0995_016141 [Termitomyces sp. Mi166|nr:hypothetical protein C0995_016141 [Termitomyces sp. Mi166\
MSNTLNSLIHTVTGKGSSGTGSHVLAVVFTITSFTLHVVQNYLSTPPIANVKHIPILPPAQPPIPTTATATRPLTPTRTADFVDSNAGASYILFSLLLVLIGILVGAGSTYIRRKSGNIFTPRDPSQNREQDQDPPRQPPNSPSRDEEPSNNAENQDEPSGEEHQDSPGDPEDGAEEEEDDEEGNGDENANVSTGSPGDDPNGPSGSSNVDDIPPPFFEPDPWDVLALTLLYIFVVASTMRHVFRKRFIMNALVRSLRTSAISLRTSAISLRTFAISLRTFAISLRTSAISIRTRFIERTLQKVDESFFWIESVRVSMEMDTMDASLHNDARGLRNATASVMPKLSIMDKLREVKPTLIEGLLTPILSQVSQVSSSIHLEVPELPEPIVQALPLPAPEPTIELIVQAFPSPEPTIEPMVQALPLPTPDPPIIPPPEPFVIEPDPSSTEAESEFLNIVRAVSGWGTVVLLIRRVVREWRQRRPRAVQHQPEVEIEDESEDEDEGSTAVEHSNNSVTSDALDAHEDQRENDEDEEVEVNQPSDTLDTSFVTAQEISITADTEEPSHEDRPAPPTITFHSSPSVPSTPEPATTYPSGTPSFTGLLTSSTFRPTGAQEAESRSATPIIRVFLSAPNTPETAATYPIGTPSFSDVLTSSTLRHARKAESSLGPSFIQSTLSAPDPTNTPSFADVATPFTFSFPSPRRTNTGPDAGFMNTSSTPGGAPLSYKDPSFSFSPLALLRKRRRLDEAGRMAIRLATPSFNAVPTSSPAVGHNRRWLLDDIGTPTRNTFRSMLSPSENHSSPAGIDIITKSKPTIMNTNITFSTLPSFNGVFCSPAAQRSRRWPVEEMKETSLVDEKSSFPHFVPNPTDEGSDLAEDVESEAEGRLGYVVEDEKEKVEGEHGSDVETEEAGEEEQTHEAEVAVEEQVHEDDDLGEKDMEIEEEDHSIIYDLEMEPEQAELTPEPTPVDAGNSFTSEGNQTVLDPEIIARGAADMLRLLREEMEREKAAKEAAKEEEARKRRAAKGKGRERESSRVRGEVMNGARCKYVGPLEALKREALEEERSGRTGGFAQPELLMGSRQAGSSSLSQHNTHEANLESPHERMIREVAKMRALVVRAYASQHYDDGEIDKLTLWHLGFGNVNMEGGQ